MVNLLGGGGYIGKHFNMRYECITNTRDDITPVGSKILYLISTTHNNHPPSNPYIDIDTNLTTLIRVLENSRRLSQVEFNFVSSWFVYGSTDQPLKESARCEPKGFYSITKRAAEQLLIEYCNMHGMSWRIMRLCNVIGSNDHTSSANKNVLHAICQKLRANKPVTLVNNGNFYRDYLHVDDVCDALHCIIHQSPVNQIYNVGTGSPVLFGSLVKYLIEKYRSTSMIQNQTSSDVIDCLMDCSRLRALGWRPAKSWQAAVDTILSES